MCCYQKNKEKVKEQVRSCCHNDGCKVKPEQYYLDNQERL